ncbi:MAG: homocysteine S-methyltransferase family protein [Ruminococcus sp.]|nr:homocysteine S-methyltransferase family protein [Ruminococcus sp.]
MNFNELIKKDFVLLDGAMGTMLQKSGLKLGEIPETLNITNPEAIISIHKAYVEAGSEIISTNTFGANSYKMKNCGYSVTELIGAAVKNARSAARDKALVALDIGPIGQLLEPAGSLSFERAYEYFKEEVLAGKDADVIFFETFTDLLELKAGVLAALENCEKPVVASMTFEENARTFAGVSVACAALTLEGLGVSALGVNCSLGPDELSPIVKEFTSITSLPIFVKPNAGLPDPNSNSYNVSAEDFAESMDKITDFGTVKLVGGCCGTTPDYIRALKDVIDNKSYKKAEIKIDTAVCSATTAVEINQPRIIGERINPTGKKLFKQALINNDIDYILSQAISQVKAGADILDVNVGLPEIDEKEMMVRVIKALQAVVDVPLQIDSTKPEVLEAALRIYNGKPIINSVNGEEKSLSTVLPLVKKYGASVVGLTLDENGIPKTAEGRFEIAKRIVERAKALGIPSKDVYIDCLTLTVSAEQSACKQTLKALNRVKTELGCKTCLGVSNISFGLPNRPLINHIFLTMALEEGLDLPIINPNDELMTGSVRAYKVLSDIDKNSRDFIEAYNEVKTQAPKIASSHVSLFDAIVNGLKGEAGALTEKALESKDAMEIVNGDLIPALDKVGADFESNKIFLPQLIQSANVAQVCFEVIKKYLQKNNNAPVSKGKIILATVKGDIHDIGKNIVKVLLDNYGYTVVDLGRDVAPELIVETAIKQDIKLIGLSALMTTTLKSMEDTIALARKTHELQNEDGSSKVIFFVGGAVLTADYAEKIGADYYCKDAKESVDTAKKVFGN